MIKVYSGPHVKFAALLMVEQLSKLGHSAEWVSEVDPKSPDLHIIYQAIRVAEFPKDYIICQTEPRGSHWFTPSYFKALTGAISVWDYDTENWRSYACFNKNLEIVHPGIKPQPSVKKDIDFLFYGWIEGSEHRKKTLNWLSKKVNLTIVTDKLEDEMWATLARTKVVINIQHKPGNPMELYRICEALSFGCNVVTEGDFNEYIMGCVLFTNSCMMDTDCKIMLERNISPRNLSSLDNLEEIKHGLEIWGI